MVFDLETTTPPIFVFFFRSSFFIFKSLFLWKIYNMFFKKGPNHPSMVSYVSLVLYQELTWESTLYHVFLFIKEFNRASLPLYPLLTFWAVLGVQQNWATQWSCFGIMWELISSCPQHVCLLLCYNFREWAPLVGPQPPLMYDFSIFLFITLNFRKRSTQNEIGRLFMLNLDSHSIDGEQL